MKLFPGTIAALLASAALFAASAPNSATAATAHPANLTFSCAPFGSIGYIFGNALEDLSNKYSPNLKVTSSEGPGSTAVTMKLATDPAWKDRVGCTSLLDFTYADLGIAPFFPSPDPKIKQNVKILFNYLYGAIGLLTRDPDIKSVSDLAGKTVGLGRRSQAHWGGVPALVFEKGAPDLKVKLSYLGSGPAHDALADGKVAAISSQIVISPDGQDAILPGIVSQLLSQRHDVHLLGFSSDIFDKLHAAQVPFKPIKVSNQLVPGTVSGAPVEWVFSPAAIAVSADFPDEQAYELTKLVLDHAQNLPKYNAMFKVLDTPSKLLGDWNEDDLHPGALKAYREAGLLK